MADAAISREDLQVAIGALGGQLRSDMRSEIESAVRPLRHTLTVLTAAMGIVAAVLSGAFFYQGAAMDSLASQVAAINARTDGFASRWDGINTRLDGMATRMDELATRMDEIQSRIAAIESNIQSIQETLHNRPTPGQPREERQGLTPG